jgi:leucyl-tRNA synthetase
METYDPKTIEPKWQKRWLDENLFAAEESSAKKKMYVLDMFPYPSGDGLHVGHVKIYTASDIVSRYLRMKGFNVLHPTGWDAFGLPTENTAIKKGIHPAELTKQNIERFRKQMQGVGLSYDWNREINTTDPAYYKWTQWIFLRLYRMGLAYQDTIPINWCPSCKTGLANEEVVEGACERCGTPVEERPMRQWMLRITKYADHLLEGLGGLDWPDFVKELQRNWIGRSEGTEIMFQVDGKNQELSVFTTRPDTLFGATYIVLSPGHPLIPEVVSSEQKAQVDAYIQEAQKPVRIHVEKEKTGVFTGAYALHPITNKQIPIWVADYVLMSYGAGAIMAVPAHDERDAEFAQKYSLPVEQVIVPTKATGEASLPYTGPGVLINSQQFNGMSTEEGGKSIASMLQLKGKAKKAVHYKLRDWVFSRQRYWGEPIPIIHCDNCGVVPVPDKDLRVSFPVIDKYEHSGTGDSPLAAVEEWVKVKCPTCPNIGRRETNTMPQWAGSSWYWLRYVSPYYREGLADAEALKRWLPVDIYIGGSEHAVLHLMYARFWQKALFDQGVVSRNEPFKRFRAVGLIMGEDNQKMSKSRGNVVNPDDVIEQYGADALRVYEMFMGPFEASAAWNTNGLKGARRFLDRAWNVVMANSAHKEQDAAEAEDIELVLQKTIRRVSEGTEQFKFNTAIAAMMELLNTLEAQTKRAAAGEARPLTRTTIETFVLLLAPYAPHMAEELWQQLGHGQSLTYAPWPAINQKILEKAAVTVPVQVNGKVRGELLLEPGLSQEEVQRRALALPNVAKHASHDAIKKTIYVPDRLINFVV